MLLKMFRHFQKARSGERFCKRSVQAFFDEVFCGLSNEERVKGAYGRLFGKQVLAHISSPVSARR